MLTYLIGYNQFIYRKKMIFSAGLKHMQRLPTFMKMGKQVAMTKTPIRFASNGHFYSIL